MASMSAGVTGDGQVTLADAIGNVEVLDEIALPDVQPCIEAHSLPQQYRCNFDTNFDDKTAFLSSSKCVEEAMRHAELVGHLILHLVVL